MLTKRFVKAQAICDAVQGYPSSYCWVIMCLHFLLRFEYIPNIQRADINITRRRNNKLDFRMHEVGEGISLSSSHVQRLQGETALSLLNKLVIYLNSDFNHEVHSMTLRGVGNQTVVPKSLWFRSYKWRLSVEDPFERIDALKSHDLGNTLNHDTNRRLHQIFKSAATNFSKAMNSSHLDDRTMAWNELFALRGRSMRGV